MSSLVQDVRLAGRTLRKSPGFTAVAVIVLALGIGANTAIFSVVNAVLLRPLPFAQPDRLVEISEGSKSEDWSVDYLDFVEWQRQQQAFQSFALTSSWDVTLSTGNEARQIRATYATVDFLKTLGVAPMSGRDFLSSEDQGNGTPVAIITYAFWQKQFGGSSDVIGRSVSIDRHLYTIVGVLPPSFRYHRGGDLYIPFANCIESHGMNVRGNHNNSWAIARLKPGMSMQQAQTQMDAIATRLTAQFPETNTGLGIKMKPLREVLVSGSRQTIFMLFGSVALVLLIACSNVANLLLVRASGRRREIAIRAAIGATRTDVIRQLIIESLTLSLLAAAAGVLLASFSFQFLVRTLPWGFAESDIHLDAWVMLFCVSISVATGVVFGLIPAIGASRIDLSDAIKESGRATSPDKQRTRMRSILVVGQIAIAAVLLISAGLLIRSVHRLTTINSGFRTESVLTVETSWPGGMMEGAPQLVSFNRQLIERVQSLPGVQSAGGVWPTPLAGIMSMYQFYREDRPVPERGKFPFVGNGVATPGYFASLGIPLLKGRFFAPADGIMPAGAENMTPRDLYKWYLKSEFRVVINDAMARKFWPAEDPIGKSIRVGSPDNKGPRLTIIGVIADSRNHALDQVPEPMLYFSGYQFPRVLTLVAKTTGDPDALATSVRSVIRGIDKSVPVTKVRTLEQVVSDSVSSRRVRMLLLGTFALVAVLLAAVGIYGVMAFTVTQRTHEIGIRIAMGASPSHVLSLVMRQAGVLAIIGAAIGLAGAVAATRLLASMLFGITRLDVLTYASVAVGVIAVTLLASYIPARRAMRVDPITALHCE